MKKVIGIVMIVISSLFILWFAGSNIYYAYQDYQIRNERNYFFTDPTTGLQVRNLTLSEYDTICSSYFRYEDYLGCPNVNWKKVTVVKPEDVTWEKIGNIYFAVMENN